jgi:hypothetical protein
MGRNYPLGSSGGDYLAELDRRGLLTRVPTAIDKDSQLVPLVRLQVRGLPEQDRRALTLREPWSGYELGAWDEQNRTDARACHARTVPRDRNRAVAMSSAPCTGPYVRPVLDTGYVFPQQDAGES